MDSSENRQILLNSVANLFCEDDFLSQEKGNFTRVYVFDLVKLAPRMFEIANVADDILNQQHKAYEMPQGEALKMPDFSLKEYLQLYYLGKLPIKVFLQGSPVNNAFSIVNKIDKKFTIELKNETIARKVNDCTESYTIT